MSRSTIINQLTCFVCGESNTRLYKIPKEEERMKKWMQILGCTDLLDLGYNYLQNTAKLCGRHFGDWAFTNTTKSRLIMFALPETDAPSSGLLSPPPCQQTLPDNDNVIVQELSPVPSFTSTPKRSTTSQIILNQRSTISRLKKKIEKLKTEKLNFLRILKDKLKVDQYEFVMSQIRQCGRGKKGRRWSKKDKAFALNIYLQSPSAYRILRDKLCFPSKSTLKRYTFNVAQGPGFCPNLIKCLEMMGSKMTAQEKLCILAWDEMAVKEGLTYCPRTDTVEGFETSDAIGQLRRQASYALVFMARGVTKNWKQVLGYFFTAKSTMVQVTELVIQSICILSKCNFNVIATVCDQGSCNLGIYRDLGVSPAAPFFMVEGKQIFTLYDPPHLLKCVRNNLKNHGIHFKEPKVGNETPRIMFASWSHIEDLYEADSEKVYRSCPKITKKHVVVPGLAKLNVKLAAQVLSHSVAAALCLYSSAALLGSEVGDTAEFVGHMDKLFDSVNSRSVFSEKPYAGALSKTSGHLEFWATSIEWIQSWKFRNASTNKLLVPACKKGWIMTLRAMEGIWKSLEDYQLKFLLLNRFNQDCLENTFSSTRRRGGFRDTPDCYQFRSAIHGVIIHNFLKKSPTSNCLEDDDSVLVDFSQFNKNQIASLLEDPSSEEYLTPSQLDSVFDDSLFDNSLVIDEEDANSDQGADGHFQLDIIEENSLAYIAGYLAKRFLEKVLFCSQCKGLLVGEKVLDSSTFLTYFKEYRDTQYGLKWPTNELLTYMRDLSNVLLPMLGNAIYEERVCRKLVDTLSTVEINIFVNHTEHETAAKNYFLTAFVLMMVKHKVNTLNLKQQNDKSIVKTQAKKRKHVYESNN